MSTQLTCDVCGGKLVIQPGKDAVCEVCGLAYSIESLREKFNSSSQAPTAKQPAAQTPAAAPNLKNRVALARNHLNAGGYDGRKKAREISDEILSVDYGNWEAWSIKIQASATHNEYNQRYGTHLTASSAYFKEAREQITNEENWEKLVTEVRKCFVTEVRFDEDSHIVASNLATGSEELASTYVYLVLDRYLTYWSEQDWRCQENQAIWDAHNIWKLMRGVPETCRTKMVDHVLYKYATDAEKLLRSSSKSGAAGAKVYISDIMKDVTEHQASRTEKYWAAHPQLKAELDRRAADLRVRLDDEKRKIESNKAVLRCRELERMISELKKEQETLGIFSLKRKKEVQTSLQALHQEYAQISPVRDRNVTDSKKVWEELKKQLQKIQKELQSPDMSE